MADITIAILGTGRPGLSVGLALKRYNAKPDAVHKFTITGFSSNAAQMKTAQKLDAFHELARSAPGAVAGRDIVVLALPYAEIEAAYRYIAPDLRPGAVVLDLSPLTAPSLAWAAKHLPKGVHMVGITPIFNPKYLFEGVDDPERASADLFENGTWLVMPAVNCVPEAIELARDFAAIMGAVSQFIDPAENDSLVTLTESLPMLLGVAYYHLIANNDGWNDLQKLTNPAFGMLTRHLYDTHPDDLRDQWLHDRASLARNLGNLINLLEQTRQALTAGEREARDTLEALSGASAASYEGWYNRRVKNQWDKALTPEVEAPGLMSTLFGGYLANRFRRNKDTDSDR